METLTDPRATADPPAASHPQWVLLNYYVNAEDMVADVTTAAASCTSSGQSFSVSFSPAATPATSKFYSDWIGSAPGDGGYRKDLRILAAHDDAVLNPHPDQCSR
ncbi:unnamed protein product [Urochloa humidicola]